MKKLVVSLMFTFLIGGLQLQASEIVLSPSCRFVSLVLNQDEYAQWDDSLFAKYTQKLYDTFHDDFDFIVYVTNEPTRPAKFYYSGINYPVSIKESGLGLDGQYGFPYDYTAYYGSDGRLQSVIHLPASTFIVNGPFLHEIMHRWGNFAIPLPINFDNSRLDSHWGIMGGSCRGQLGGFDESTLQSNVDGDPTKYSVSYFAPYANGGNMVPYTDFELYLMGMIPLSDVHPFTAFNSIDSYSRDQSTGKYTFFSQDKTVYNSASLEEILGARVPDYTTSQKSFNVLFVVVSSATLTTEEYANYDASIESFCKPSSDGISAIYNFWEATRGLGTLTAENLNASLKQTNTVNVPSVVNELTLSPNVVGSEGFYIRNVKENSSYVMYDAKGKKVAAGAIPSNGFVSSSSLTTGVYKVSVLQGNTVKVLMLICK